MQWITIAWSMVAAASLTLGAMHFLIWWKQRGAWGNLLVLCSALGAAAVAAFELALARAQTPEQYGALLRWALLATFVLSVSLVFFIRVYLRAGRRWLAWTVVASRAAVVILNFSLAPNLHYTRLTGLRQGHLPGGETVSVPVGDVSPWSALFPVSMSLMILYLADAMISVWRRGERRRALVLCGSTILFVLVSTAHSLLVLRGIVQSPFSISIAYLLIVAAMTYEVSSDVVAGAALAKRLRVSEQTLLRTVDQMNAAVRAAEAGEARARESEARFVLMANAAPVLVWVAGLDKLCTFFNQPWLDFTGRTPEQELGDGWSDGVHPADLDRCLRTYVKAFDQRRPFTMEYRLRRHDGEYRWVLDHGVPRHDADRNFLGYIGSCIDVTDRRRAEDRFRLAVEASPNGIVLADRDGHITLANAQVEDTFGYARGELIGRSIEELVPERLPECPPGYHEAPLASARAPSTGSRRELFARRKDGTQFPVEIGIRRIESDEGAFVLAAIADISARKRAEAEALRQRAELAHLSRAAMLGELSGSLAHELNQPLAAILSNAETAQKLLARNPIDLDEIRAILTDVIDDDTRASEVIRRLRLLLKKGELNPQRLDVNEVLRDTLWLVHSDLVSRGISVHTVVQDGLPAVTADRVQLQQVLLNLIVNACEAMSENNGHDRKLLFRTSRGDGTGVQISVTDHGTGIASGLLERVFESFFTTKPQGMGLGLRVCRTIIDAHSGRLWATNNPERGASFHIALPAERD